MLGPRSAFNHLSFIIIAISLSYLLGYGARDILATCSNPKLINTTWEQIDNPDSVGWSREKLREACEYSQTIKTAALILIYRGKVLYHWGEIDRKFWVHSIRKPFLSALYGIHLDEGDIDLSKTMLDLGINDNPYQLTPTEKTATVRMLLQSRSGIYIEAACETQEAKDTRPPRGSHLPGTFFYYNNWDFNAAGTVFQQEAAVTIHGEFKNRIAEPIGMEDFESNDVYYEYEPVSMPPCYKFRMTALDMARFGLLYLRNGLWDGNRIISEEWIKESTTAYSDLGDTGGYGYMWAVSLNGKPGDFIPGNFYYHTGYGGHMLMIIPKLDLVIVHRVNTDIGHNVGDELPILVGMILNAKKKIILPAVILLLN
jgi:CubicO group peptidase (beta-lactamase class C family)